MLVLKRKVGEKIKIGDDVEIQILSVEGDTIKLGFNAPRHVQIMRSELYDSIRDENMQAGAHGTEHKQLLALLGKRFKDE